MQFIYVLGVVESYAMPNDVFEAQRKTFKKFGYAVNPDREFEHHQSSGYVGDVDKAVRYGGATVNDAVPEDVKLLKYNKKRLHKGDVFQAGNYLGPWAGYEGEEVTAEVIQPTEEDIQKAKVYVDDIIKMRQVQAETSYETSVFHGKRERDALGRTYMDVPHDVDIDLTRDPGDHECFAPKTLIHTWSVVLLWTTGMNLPFVGLDMRKESMPFSFSLDLDIYCYLVPWILG